MTLIGIISVCCLMALVICGAIAMYEEYKERHTQ